MDGLASVLRQSQQMQANGLSVKNGTRSDIAVPCITNRSKNRREGEVTVLNILQDAKPSRTQKNRLEQIGEGEAPAELWLSWLRRSVALPSAELVGLVVGLVGATHPLRHCFCP
jgi:hypothetical protein